MRAASCGPTSQYAFPGKLVAALRWHSEVRVVSEATAGIVELKRVIGHALGWKGICQREPRVTR